MNNNVVKADAMEKPAQSNNAQGGQQGATGEANGTQGDQPPTPQQNPILKIQQLKCNMLVQKRMLITESHDNLDPQKEIDIDATNSTEWDAVKCIKNKYGKNSHIKIDDSDVEYDFISTVRDKNGKSVSYVVGPNRREGLVSMSLEDGDVIQVVAVPRQLDSNKWYSWTPVDNQFGSKGNQGDPINHAKKLMGGDLPDDIANRVVDDKTTGKLIEQTDEYGNLPTIVSAKNADGKIFNWVEIDLHPHLNSWFLKVLKKQSLSL